MCPRRTTHATSLAFLCPLDTICPALFSTMGLPSGHSNAMSTSHINSLPTHSQCRQICGLIFVFCLVTNVSLNFPSGNLNLDVSRVLTLLALFVIFMWSRSSGRYIRLIGHLLLTCPMVCYYLCFLHDLYFFCDYFIPNLCSPFVQNLCMIFRYFWCFS